MKKSVSIIALFAGLLFAFIFLTDYQRVSASGPLAVHPTGSIPDSVMTFFKNTCMDCHADGGNGMAKSHVNFSKWDTYSTDKQADKASDICDMITKGKMPTKGWLKNNPDLAPQKRDIDKVCKWADTFKK
ncbi:MAG: heme-binding domain-containing protein [Bacteroidales bacterium]|jgi:hypothetical protein|nr:heme-binding domain-containing protein [Bacteroidales bacterium]